MCLGCSPKHRERTSCQKSCGRKRSFWPPRPPIERPSSASIGGGGAAGEAETEAVLSGKAVMAALSSWTRGSGEAAVPGLAASAVAAGSSSACSHELRGARMTNRRARRLGGYLEATTVRSLDSSVVRSYFQQMRSLVS
jgi:hypothetical protein